jgi:hypothetical protein
LLLKKTKIRKVYDEELIAAATNNHQPSLPLNLSALAIFIHARISTKALSLARRTPGAWCLVALSLTLLLRSCSRAMEGYDGKWEGLALGLLSCAFMLCAAIAILRERVVGFGVLRLVVPVVALGFGASDRFLGLLPEFDISFRDYPPRQWAQWPIGLLVISTALAGPR